MTDGPRADADLCVMCRNQFPPGQVCFACAPPFQLAGEIIGYEIAGGFYHPADVRIVRRTAQPPATAGAPGACTCGGPFHMPWCPAMPGSQGQQGSDGT